MNFLELTKVEDNTKIHVNVSNITALQNVEGKTNTRIHMVNLSVITVKESLEMIREQMQGGIPWMDVTLKP